MQQGRKPTREQVIHSSRRYAKRGNWHPRSRMQASGTNASISHSTEMGKNVVKQITARDVRGISKNSHHHHRREACIRWDPVVTGLLPEMQGTNSRVRDCSATGNLKDGRETASKSKTIDTSMRSHSLPWLAFLLLRQNSEIWARNGLIGHALSGPNLSLRGVRVGTQEGTADQTSEQKSVSPNCNAVS